MNTVQSKLHILIDSRESSVSLARHFYNDLNNHSLGVVEHFRGLVFANNLKFLLERCSDLDEILVAVNYLPQDQLALAAPILQKGQYAQCRITLATYECFTFMRDWCSETGCHFLANLYKKRTVAQTVTTKRRNSAETEQLDRIWIQYRLMLAIISRTVRLSDTCRQLILGHPMEGGTLEKEYTRARRFFYLGEPDMAGGTYSCEDKQSMNPVDELRFRVNKIAATDFNVLIKGESGSGKETIAWAIHELSARRDKPFMVINCAGLPDELLESEMFGYRKGSHNQAYDDSPGILGSANGGTLFLDELPDMSPRVQAKLLRFVESGEYRPLGSTENRYSDTRIIAAGQVIRLDASGVRPDLKSRIGQLDLEIAPLRDVEARSPGTIYKIAFILLERYTWTTIFHENRMRELTPCDIRTFQDRLALKKNLDVLSNQEWKESNIRELNNFLRKWLVFGDNEFKVLKRSAAVSNQTPEQLDRPVLYDEELKGLLLEPGSREELKALFLKNPLQNLKKSYMRHLFAIYSKIIERENTTSDRPKKPTQKELAKLIDVTENTISRHLN